jgi:hypothetical protein
MQPASRDPLHWCAWKPTVLGGVHPLPRLPSQTWSRPTLVVKSKTRGIAVLSAMLEIQRDRIHASGDTHAYSITATSPPESLLDAGGA